MTHGTCHEEHKVLLDTSPKSCNVNYSIPFYGHRRIALEYIKLQSNTTFY